MTGNTPKPPADGTATAKLDAAAPTTGENPGSATPATTSATMPAAMSATSGKAVPSTAASPSAAPSGKAADPATTPPPAAGVKAGDPPTAVLPAGELPAGDLPAVGPATAPRFRWPPRFQWLPLFRRSARSARPKTDATAGNSRRPAWVRPVTRAVVRAGLTAVVGVLAVVLGLYGLPELAALRSGPELSSPSGTSLPTGFPPAPAPSAPEPGAGAGLPGTRTPGPVLPGTGSTEPPVRAGGRPSDSLAPWARRLGSLGVPQVALQAYGYAELVVTRTQPTCKLSWTMLAGIGSVESNHGRHGGAKLLDNGTSDPRVLGIPLDGKTTERIADTDGGALDGNASYDQAVGPMQFIPATWKTWAADADGDGKADPFDIDDAALTAGYYLCANGRDLSTADGWWSAVLSYNHVTRYAMDVFNATDNYGKKSLQA